MQKNAEPKKRPIKKILNQMTVEKKQLLLAVPYEQGMQPHPLTKLIRFEKIWLNLYEISAKLW